MKKILIITYLLIFSLSVFSQENEKYDLLRHRLNRIDEYHVGVGVESALNTNLIYGIKTYVGYGNFRHILDADFGIGLRFWNLPVTTEDKYQMIQFPICISLCINPIRWTNGCLYIGEETSFQLGLWNIATDSENKEYNDKKALANYFSLRGKLGVILGSINIGLFYEQDLSSFCNQKYIYESGKYSFDKLHNSIYEHNRIGFSVSYNFKLK